MSEPKAGAFEQTAEWWNATVPDGRPNSHLSLRELADTYGDVTPEGWGYRRAQGKRRGLKADFPSLAVGRGGQVDRRRTVPQSPEEPAYSETFEMKPDGTYESSKLVWLNAEQCKSKQFMLECHGFDPAEWEIVSARNNMYQGFSKNEDGGHDVSTLYSSKITVRPLQCGFTIEEMVDAVCAAVTPVKVRRPRHGQRLLEVSITDAHFGNSTLAWYRDTLSFTKEHIEARRWEQIVVWVGSDFFHCDNFKNTTSNGTPQSSVWWPDAWKDGLEFIGTIIEAALANAKKVFVYYVPGNHDESMAWAFSQLLAARYTQVVFDTDIAERKVHVFGKCAIGMTHGDEKTRNDLDRVFGAEFPHFASAAFREVHMGHLHHEKSVDKFGTVSRSLPTGARTDKWHRETGFVGARKKFLLFEWQAERGVTDTHYV